MHRDGDDIRRAQILAGALAMAKSIGQRDERTPPNEVAHSMVEALTMGDDRMIRETMVCVAGWLFAQAADEGLPPELPAMTLH